MTGLDTGGITSTRPSNRAWEPTNVGQRLELSRARWVGLAGATNVWLLTHLDETNKPSNSLV